jgi:23S rRNA pseudouridine1911/1915/1917 synthase
MPKIVLDTDKLLFVNKPHGVSSVPDLTNSVSIQESVKVLLQQQVHPLHRIDKPASGLLVFAKDTETMKYYSNLMQTNSIKRTYLAITKIGNIQQTGNLTQYLNHMSKSNKTQVNDSPKKDFKRSTLNYQIVDQLDRYMLWKIELETGRTHQIRAQLAHIGFPIRGDVKYGARRSIEGRAILLHSFLWTLPGSEESGESFSVKALPVNFDLWHRFDFIKALKMQ